MPANSDDRTEARAGVAQRLLWWLAVALLLARLCFVVAHQPLAGFANQFDMLRTTGCLGLVPDSDAAPAAATPAAPVSRYRVEQPRNASCLLGTEVAIAALARGVDAIGDLIGIGDPATMPTRLLASTKALLLLLALALVDRRLRAHPGVRLAHAWIAALVLVDPFNTLYLAGFYTEFAALLSAYLALALPLLWLLADQAPTRRALLGWGLVLAALALSRFQHAVIPLVLLAWLLWLARGRRWSLLPIAAWPLLILIPALALQLGLQRQYQTIADANRWNSFFGAALPAADDPAAFAASLGLPPVCAELVHTTWYLQRGRDARTECPQAFVLSRLRWAAALATEPAALARMVGRGVAISGQWRPGYLGELAGQRGQRMAAGQWQLGASVADVVARLPFLGLLLFWGWPLLLWLAGWALASDRRGAANKPAADLRHPAEWTLVPIENEAHGVPREPDQRIAMRWLWPMLAAIVVLGWMSSLVGDGYSELARHLHLAANAALVAMVLGVNAIVAGLRRPQPAYTLRARWLLAIAAILVLATGAWLNMQALAFGVLDQPAGERYSHPLRLSGWALDPRGIERVELVWPDGQRQSLSLQPRPDLASIFGAGVGGTGVGFDQRIAMPGQAPTAIAIEVIPKHGAPTVIDRRWLR